ncbi:MAG: response regulator [Chthoniobacterales bacterium]|nr:response regulator [Chthoniobacterales bacterium]
MSVGRPRLLIVEDEPRLREFLERASTSMDFEPVAVRAAESALKTIEEQPIDVGIFDLTLPGMSGMELLELLRQRNINIPVIILTGYGSLESARAAIRLEVVDFLTKPCSLEELDAALSRARRRLLNDAPSNAANEVNPSTNADSPPTTNPTGTLEALERDHIFAALRYQKGNRAAAAAQLGISERTLYYRLNRYQQQGTLPDDCRQR